MKINGSHWKCIENFRAMISIRTVNIVYSHIGVGSGEGACIGCRHNGDIGINDSDLCRASLTAQRLK